MTLLLCCSVARSRLVPQPTLATNQSSSEQLPDLFIRKGQQRPTRFDPPSPASRKSAGSKKQTSRNSSPGSPGPSVSLDKVLKILASTQEAAEEFSSSSARLNMSVTPKQFLKLIDSYHTLSAKASAWHADRVAHLNDAMERMGSTECDLELLESSLTQQSEAVQEKAADVELKLEDVAKEAGEQAEAQTKANAVEVDRKAVQELADTIEDELKQLMAPVEPLKEKGCAALANVTKDAFGEIKGFTQPPPGVGETLAAVLYLLSPRDKLAKDVSFKAAKKAMAKPDKILTPLNDFDWHDVPIANISAARSILSKPPEVDPVKVGKRCEAAGHLAAWCWSLIQYNQEFEKHTELRADLEAAQKRVEPFEKKAKSSQKVHLT